MSRDYVGWYKLKADIEKNRQAPEFSERDVWWCSIGANIGSEEDGKNNLFERPVLVVRKFNKELFIGVPLSSVQKDSHFYHGVKVADQLSSVIVSQQRALSAKRLLRKVGRVGEGDFNEIIIKISALIKKSGSHKSESLGRQRRLYSNSSKHEYKSQVKPERRSEK